jgi:hypothetical protein
VQQPHLDLGPTIFHSRIAYRETRIRVNPLQTAGRLGPIWYSCILVVYVFQMGRQSFVLIKTTPQLEDSTQYHP